MAFLITANTNAALFSAGPAVSLTGTLTYTPAADAFGAATVTLKITDDGGTANGGVDESPTQSFTITVNPGLGAATGLASLAAMVQAGTTWVRLATAPSPDWTPPASGWELGAVIATTVLGSGALASLRLSCCHRRRLARPSAG